MTNPRTRARNRGKALEKSVAKQLGGKRNGATGLATADVETPTWSVECKSKQQLPGWLVSAMRQAVINAPESKTPILILHQLGTLHDSDIVCMTWRHWRDWHGEINAKDD